MSWIRAGTHAADEDCKQRQFAARPFVAEALREAWRWLDGHTDEATVATADVLAYLAERVRELEERP